MNLKTEWHKRLAAFKKYYGYTNADLARMSGNTLQSVKNISQGEVPGWLKFAIQVWENEYSRITAACTPCRRLAGRCTGKQS